MKKVLSLMLILAMVLTMASFPAFAADAVATGITVSDAAYPSPLWGKHTAQSGKVLSNAVDGDATTYFLSDQYNPAGPFDLVFVLETAGTLDSLTINWGGAGWGSMAPEAYTVSIAGEDEVFTPYLTYTGLYDKDAAAAAYSSYEYVTGSKGGGRLVYNINETGLNIENAKYIKITIDKCTYRPAIYEISATVIPGGTTPEIPEDPKPEVKEDTVEALGANIRLATEDLSAGLRFGATVNKADLLIEGDYVYDEASDVQLGMYLLPAEMLADGETLEAYIAAGKTEVLDVPAKKVYAQDDETVTFTAVLVDIPAEAYAKEIVAVPYVKVGEDTTFFEEKDQSYAGVAQAALDANEAGTVTLTEDQINALKDILGIEDEPEVPEVPEVPEQPTLTEQKVALTADNIVAQRYFPDSDWTGTDADLNTEEARALFVDGSIGTYACSGVWGSGDILEAQGFYYQVIVDLGAEKNISKVNFHVGADGYGNGWQYAAPLDAEISVAGEDGAYTSVYTYEAAGNEDYRLDTVTLDHTTDGAGVRYIKYKFQKINANATIAEIEVYEMAAGTPGEGGETPEPEEPEVPAEPALITGITVTADGITSAFPDTRTYDIICNGVSGEGQAIAWGDELFISAETYAPGDGTAPLFTLTFDLGAKYDVSRFFVGIGWDTGDITAADLYGSNDGGATWTPVKTGMATGWSAGFDGGDMIGVDLTNASYSMFKLEVMNVSKEANMQIHEIEFTGVPVTGDAGEEPAPSLIYYNIDTAATAAGYRNNSTLPASVFTLPEGYNAYEINGTYKVDANTLRMLTTVPCIGDGTIKYKDYNNFTEYIADKSYGDGYGTHCYGEQITSAPVSKLSDPVYMSMVLPSEGTTYMNVANPGDPRNNGNNMHAVCTVANCTRCNKVEYVKLNALGALYLNESKKDELENYKDVQFKLCLGNIKLIINTANGGWRQVELDAAPTSGNGGLYCLPWTLEWNNATSQTYLNNCKSLTNVSRKTNYSEIPLTVSDFFFTKTFQGTDRQWYTIDERVLHFWGSQYSVANDDEILGVIASYDMWIEYDESIGIKLEDYFISSIGADWRYSNGNGGTVTRQAFAGYKHAVSTEKTTVFGHNMGPSDYDTLVTAQDLADIKGLLSIK